ATPTATEISSSAERIHSCKRRRSTASSDGVRKPRSPTTRASRRIRSSLGVDGVAGTGHSLPLDYRPRQGGLERLVEPRSTEARRLREFEIPSDAWQRVVLRSGR